MQKSKDMFLEVIQENQMYDYTFTKREAVSQGKKVAKQIIDNGDHDPLVVLGNVARLKEVVNAIYDGLKQGKFLDAIDKEYSQNGVTFQNRNTGNRYDYAVDEKYRELEEQLKQRKELLNQAIKSDTPIYTEEYDPETGEMFAAQVPKVPIKTVGKQTTAIIF